jgi:hypothetical protein
MLVGEGTSRLETTVTLEKGENIEKILLKSFLFLKKKIIEQVSSKVGHDYPAIVASRAFRGRRIGLSETADCLERSSDYYVLCMVREHEAVKIL